MNPVDLNAKPWEVSERGFSRESAAEEKLAFLLRYAVLAPSTHNTQPWKFSVGANEIQVYADSSRWLKVADPDQRELYISVGCALENLLVAARHFGYTYQVNYFPDAGDEALVARVAITGEGKASSLSDQELFYAIPLRQTNREIYASQPVHQKDLERLQSCTEPDIDLFMTDDPAIKRRVDELMVQADVLQFADPKFRQELAYWLGQGVFGHPWLIARMGQLAVTYLNMGESIAKKDSELLMSAPILAVITSKTNDRQSQVRVGQTFERLALTATSLGIGLQPMSQVLQVAAVRPEIEKLIPAKGVFAQFTFRLGYAEAGATHTPRQTLESVLI